MSAVGSDLYLRYVLPDDSHDGINRKVYAGTPWITNAFTGSPGDARSYAMITWCRDRFGEEAFPFGREPRAGRWHRGGATVYGWTWFGFSTAEEMAEFEAAWAEL